MTPEKRKNFFLVLAYYHHIIGSPGITVGGAVPFLTADKRTCQNAAEARIVRNLLALLNFCR
jgi:hypothetical protein